MFLWFYFQELRTAQPAVVLVLKRLCVFVAVFLVPVLAGWVYAFCDSMSRNSRITKTLNGHKL